MRLSGKVAFVSGAARPQGIGAATVRLFSLEGAHVVFGDIREDDGLALSKEIASLGGSASFVPLDVTSEQEWIQAIKSTVDLFGHLDILVNNAAGGGGRGTTRRGGGMAIEEMSVDSWDGTMAAIARGTFLGTKIAIPALRQSGGGSIINVSSQLGLVGSDNNSSAYHAAKGAVTIFTKAAALQYVSDNIRVNSIQPGPIATDSFVQGHSGSRLESVVSRIPQGKAGTPEDVAYGILYLASDESRFVTGSELVVDGGWTAQ